TDGRQAETPRSRTKHHSPQTLQHSHRTSLYRLGQTLHSLSSQTASRLYGCPGDPCLSVLPGGGGEGGRLYPNPGIKRSRFPVQGSSPSERRFAWEGGTSKE